jgi:hypothetical protein
MQQGSRSLGRILMAIAGAAALASVACGGDSSVNYDVDFDDLEYDLSAMQIGEADLPDLVRPTGSRPGLTLVVEDAFTNDEWARAFESQIPEIVAAQKVVQLDAQGRINGHLALFTWRNPTEHLGKVQQVESHAMLYRDAEAAANAIALRACGLIVADSQQLDQFDVPPIADESAGFTFTTQVGAGEFSLGIARETVVCARTGRLVHAIVQYGLDGTTSEAVGVELMRRKLAYVDAAFEGKDPPAADNSEG